MTNQNETLWKGSTEIIFLFFAAYAFTRDIVFESAGKPFFESSAKVFLAFFLALFFVGFIIIGIKCGHQLVIKIKG